MKWEACPGCYCWACQEARLVYKEEKLKPKNKGKKYMSPTAKKLLLIILIILLVGGVGFPFYGPYPLGFIIAILLILWAAGVI